MYNIKAKHIIIAVVVILAFVGIAMFGMPVYRVWSQEMKGKAELAEAEQNRRIKIEEAGVCKFRKVQSECQWQSSRCLAHL